MTRFLSICAHLRKSAANFLALLSGFFRVGPGWFCFRRCRLSLAFFGPLACCLWLGCCIASGQLEGSRFDQSQITNHKSQIVPVACCLRPSRLFPREAPNTARSASASPRLRGDIFGLGPALQEATNTARSAPKEPDDQSGTKVVAEVIKAINEHYLRVQANPLWNIAREALLRGKYHDSAEAFAAIQKQLPGLEDSELNFLTPEQISAVQAAATGQKIGIGLADFCVDQEYGTGRARVVTPLAGSPAMLKGLEPSDVILSVNGKTTSNMSHEEVMDALRSGTVRLQLERGEKTLNVELEPSSAALQPLRYEAKKVGGRNIGYIRVAMFTPDLPTLAREAVTKLEQGGVEGYVLDLRNNPGGYLSAATGLAGLFAKGTLGFRQDSHKKKAPIETAGTPVTDKPLAVIVNEGTASASEFLSSGLKGLHRAQLVGVRTYGRGQAQIFFPLSDGYGIQIPSVLFLTVDGQSYKGKGIEPDIEVKQAQLQEAQLTGAQDKQFQRAVQSLNAH